MSGFPVRLSAWLYAVPLGNSGSDVRFCIRAYQHTPAAALRSQDHAVAPGSAYGPGREVEDGSYVPGKVAGSQYLAGPDSIWRGLPSPKSMRKRRILSVPATFSHSGTVPARHVAGFEGINGHIFRDHGCLFGSRLFCLLKLRLVLFIRLRHHFPGHHFHRLDAGEDVGGRGDGSARTEPAKAGYLLFDRHIGADAPVRILPRLLQHGLRGPGHDRPQQYGNLAPAGRQDIEHGL